MVHSHKFMWVLFESVRVSSEQHIRYLTILFVPVAEKLRGKFCALNKFNLDQNCPVEC